MTEKLNAYVCDTCRVCCGKDAQGYPIDNGWITTYDNGVARHFCGSECAAKEEK